MSVRGTISSDISYCRDLTAIEMPLGPEYFIFPNSVPEYKV
jgi:hypothetical protein